MATKLISTRIKNKADLLSAWQESTVPLLDGEIAIVRVPTGETYTNPITGATAPKVELLMKVGDGTSSFGDLPWLSAKASDVYNWAKAQDPSTITVKYNNGSETTPSWKSATLADILRDVETIEAELAELKDNALSDITVSQEGSGVVKSVEKDGTGKIKVTRLSVAEDDIADSAVTTAKITDSNVTTAKIANGAITDDKVASGISSDKISINAKTLTTKVSEMEAAIAENAEAAAHEHPFLPDTTKYALSDEVGGDALVAKKVKNALTVTLNGGSTEDTDKFTFDGSSAKSVNITPATIGAATYESVFGADGKGGINAKVEKNTTDIEELRGTIAKGVNFRGEVNTTPTGTTYTLKNTTEPKTAIIGDLVIYGEKEYIYVASGDWKELGDLSRVGALETWKSKLQIDDKAEENQFITEVDIAENGTITINRAQPTSVNVKHGTDSTVSAELGNLAAAIVENAEDHKNYENQNAFSNIKVDDTTITADAVTDTVEFAGENVTITPAENNKITFKVADGSTNAKGVVQLHNTIDDSTDKAATPAIVKTANANAVDAQARVGAVEGDYVRFANDKLYVGLTGTDEIIFDCGGAL